MKTPKIVATYEVQYENYSSNELIHDNQIDEFKELVKRRDVKRFNFIEALTLSQWTY